jgi:ribosome maturation factor RimP
VAGILWSGERAMRPLQELLERTVAGMGYELADVEISNRGKMIRVFIEKLPEGGGAPVPAPEGVLMESGISLDDCTRVTRQLQRVLPVEGVDYDRLEVSSPGLDRKLNKEADYQRFAGSEAEIRLRVLTNGRRRLVGVLRGLKRSGESVQVCIEVDGREVVVDASNIERTRLIPRI